MTLYTRIFSKSSALLLLGVAGIFVSSSSYAWSNYFRFVNNFNVPLTITFNTDLSSVDSSCGTGTSNVEVGSRSLSCEFEFNTSKQHWYSIPGNSGTVTIAKKSDPDSSCTYSYDYSFSLIPYSYFNIRSENFYLQSCKGSMKAQEISVVNDHNKALPRPLDGNLILGLDKEKGAESTDSYSHADCGGQGGNNCLIASPDLNTTYLQNGSTLGQALALQTQIDQFEPLNFSQYIGSHNSVISRPYTNSSSDYNLSYSDPDSYLTLTDQLNSGVRQLELDILWYNNTVTICHNHVSSNLQGLLCDGNLPVRNAISEIKTWTQNHPDDLVLIYLDVNIALSGHTSDLDNELAQLEPLLFTPSMAEQNFHVTNNTLPAFQLSKYDITHIFKKNIIIINDNDADNLKTSKYVFVKVQNSAAAALYNIGMHSLLSSSLSSCNDANKYQNMKNVFSDDPNHYNILRSNGDRTIMSYVDSVGGTSSSDYVDYYTTQNLPNMLSCPLNIYSPNMLGFTCGTNDCDTHPTDPRLYSFLWSWGLGYPLQNNGSNVAYIKPKSGHFENEKLTPNIYSALCYRSTEKMNAPTAPLNWYLASVQVNDVDNADRAARLACQDSGGVFAVPTTSYWMSDAMTVINTQDVRSNNVLVNYKKVNNVWIPNVNEMYAGKSLVR